MKTSRQLVPVLGLFPLILLFLSLPEAPNVFGWFGCKACSSSDPYLPLIGSGYFSLLIVVSFLFPAFPGKYLAKGGFFWSVLLAGALIYIGFTSFCVPCLLGHLCNILIWTIWMVVPSKRSQEQAKNLRERLCLTFLAPIATIALFSSLNLTFMAYGFKMQPKNTAFHLDQGDEVPIFSASTITGDSITSRDAKTFKKIVINFVSPSCSYCREQLLIFNEVAAQLENGVYRFINVASVLRDDLIESSSSTEWVEDKDSQLQHLFKVKGYPTMFIIGPDGKIARVIQGASKELKKSLLAGLE